MSITGIVQSIAVRSARREPMQEQQEVEVTMQGGILQDYRGTGLRQVTFLDTAQWQQVLDELGADLPWHTRRANVLIAGIDLPKSVGLRLQVGDCRFAIGGETTPCQRMDELHPGLQSILAPAMRGGVWGKVLQGGHIRVGDSVHVL